MFEYYIPHNNNYQRSGAHSFEYYKLTIMFYILVFRAIAISCSANGTGISTLHPADSRLFAFPINLRRSLFCEFGVLEFLDFDRGARHN